MGWWGRAEKRQVDRVLKVPKVDSKKVQIIKLSSIKAMSTEDRSVVELLKIELTASGFLERDEEIIFTAIDDDGDSVFEKAGAQGNKAALSLPTYDADLDAVISSGIGGENMLLDESDDYDERSFNVYQKLGRFDSVKVDKTDENSVELRLPDGTIIQGRIPSKLN